MRQENAASWSDLPTSVLRAELLRRQANNHDERPACGTAGTTKDYNMPLHVFALVLILVLSTLGQSCCYIIHCSPY
jgi:zinc transporter 1/2/3